MEHTCYIWSLGKSLKIVDLLYEGQLAFESLNNVRFSSSPLSHPFCIVSLFARTWFISHPMYLSYTLNFLEYPLKCKDFNLSPSVLWHLAQYTEQSGTLFTRVFNHPLLTNIKAKRSTLVYICWSIVLRELRFSASTSVYLLCGHMSLLYVTPGP